MDFALSFQDVEGCSEIWDFIVEVQRHFRGQSQSHGFSRESQQKCLSRTVTDINAVYLASQDPNSSFGSSSDSQTRLTVASIIASGRLPEPTLGIISDLDTAIKAIAKTVHGRERICEYILNEVCLLVQVISMSALSYSILGVHQSVDIRRRTSRGSGKP